MGKRGRPRQYDRAQVARLYQEAIGFGRFPNPYIAERLGISRQAAWKLVHAARNDGLLPQTTRGRMASKPAPRVVDTKEFLLRLEGPEAHVYKKDGSPITAVDLRRVRFWK